MQSRLLLWQCRNQTLRAAGVRRLVLRWKSSLSQSRRSDTIPLQLGSTEPFNLHIHYPENQASSLPKYLVILRSGLADYTRIAKDFDHFWLDSSSWISQLNDTTVFDVEYHLSPRTSVTEQNDSSFPLPIHQVSAAWDYITRYIAQHTSRVPAHQPGPHIALCGSHIGASLALSTALSVHANAISHVAVVDPITDWTQLDQLASYKTPTTKLRTSKREQHRSEIAESAAALIRLRTRLFRTPSAYFDEFASPVLFLRAPGRDTPVTPTAAVDTDNAEYMVDGIKLRYGEEEDDVALVADGYGPYDDDWHVASTAQLRNEYYDRMRVGLDPKTGSGETDDTSVTLPPGDENIRGGRAAGPRRRKVLKKWPQFGLPGSVRVPLVNVFSSPYPSKYGTSFQDPDHDKANDLSPVTRLQAMEMVEIMKRACFWGSSKALADETVFWTDGESPGSSTGRDHNRLMLDWLTKKFEDV